MSKRLWINLLLVIALAALLVFIFFKPELAAPPAKKLFSVTPYDATAITIQRPEKATISLRKQQTRWMLEKPTQAAVNQDRIKHLLTILQEPIINSYPLDPQQLNTFGLNKESAIQLTINEETVLFGKTNAVTRNRYTLKNQQVHTIAEIIYGTLGSSLTNLLTHRLFINNNSISNIEAPALFDTEKVAEWGGLEAVNIADYVGDEIIIGEIKVTLTDNSTHTFNLFAHEPKLILGRGDINVKYTFIEQDTQSLLKTSEE
ncbi:MAG: Unknown protein [uncultured Thiotrichaceae bacterium]|uniref:Uncharacterized protein n=1 Tax=uncultured Thiotrichaceae bacterium TaxID=298394 RepID=A0A6S6T4C3_9GAMM|nr:MAG: Unknown protein [uncultured Thiotrichaceae bacterium]